MLRRALAAPLAALVVGTIKRRVTISLPASRPVVRWMQTDRVQVVGAGNKKNAHESLVFLEFPRFTTRRPLGRPEVVAYVVVLRLLGLLRFTYFATRRPLNFLLLARTRKNICICVYKIKKWEFFWSSGRKNADCIGALGLYCDHMTDHFEEVKWSSGRVGVTDHVLNGDANAYGTIEGFALTII